jgi:glycine/D-amino acid oxidase-like deaminating enzyme
MEPKDQREDQRHCDLLVVGGGINGAGIARDAAVRGLSVILCEKDDLASHTSSASTRSAVAQRAAHHAPLALRHAARSRLAPGMDDTRRHAAL